MAKKPPLRIVSGGTFTPPEDVAALAKAKLAGSGISLIDARRLGMSWHDVAETKAFTPHAWDLPSLRIPYFRPDFPQMPLSTVPGAGQFYRIRCLRDPRPMPDDFAKYLQASSGACVYFPSTTDWTAVMHNPAIPIGFTEGELKAAAASLAGMTVLGLGGVNSYKANRLGHMDLLPELEGFNWVFRDVWIAYDSDVLTNPRVCAALNDLGEALVAKGAIPRMIILPPGPNGAKVGLDDFLLAEGVERLRTIIANDSMHVSIAKTLHELNDEYAYVRSMGERIVNIPGGYLISPSGMKIAVTKEVLENHVTAGGVRSEKRVNAAAHWLSWPLRRTVQALAYLPALAPKSVVENPDPAGKGVSPFLYNTWTGWGTVPKKGSVEPFTKLLDHLFTGAEEGFRRWVIQWLAYPIQHPGTKLFSSVVIYGLEQGTGKSLVGYTMREIYGRNFAEIKQTNLHADFNEWAVGKHFIMGDDVTGPEKRQDLDILKTMITQADIRINTKGVPSYVIVDCINYLWTSNHADAFFLEDNDRRFAILEVIVGPLARSFYDGYIKWLKDGGAAAIHHYLLHYDLTGFDPAGPAMASRAKEAMKRAGRTHLGNWVRDLLTNPDDMLVLKGGAPMVGDLFTNTQIMGLYTDHAGEDEARQVNAKRLGMELTRAGAQLVYDGQSFRVPSQPGTNRYYTIRNREKWTRATLAQIQAHLQGEDKPPPPSKKKPKF